MSRESIRKSLARDCARLERLGRGSTAEWQQAYRSLQNECTTRLGTVNKSEVADYMREARELDAASQGLKVAHTVGFDS